MKHLQTAIREARDRATKVFEDHQGILRNGFVDVELLAKQLGIVVQDEKFKDSGVSGFIKMKTSDGRPMIVLNETNGEHRRRFTIAHELGHFFLHSSQSIHVDDMNTADMVMYRDSLSSLGTNIREIEANQFAAELLMPEHMITKDVESLRGKSLGMSEIVEKLSGKYAVSQAAMTIRLSR